MNQDSPRIQDTVEAVLALLEKEVRQLQQSKPDSIMVKVAIRAIRNDRFSEWAKELVDAEIKEGRLGNITRLLSPNVVDLLQRLSRAK
jgi:hypothetical protein